MRSHKVRVDGLQFAAAHFATFGGKCEPLHGHNYEVAAVLEGSLTDDAWVFDFVALKAILRTFCEELDHRFLLQCKSRLLKMDSTGGRWRIETPAGLEYELPAADVVALPVDNSTAERLAEWLAARLNDALTKRGVQNIRALRVEISEGPGQLASFSQQRLPLE